MRNSDSSRCCQPLFDSLYQLTYFDRPQENYFKLSDPGTVTVLDDGRTKHSPSSNGLHRYLITDPAQKEKVIKAYTELASAKPVVRQFRFRNQKKNADPAKPDAAKPAEVKPEAAKP